MTDTSQSVVLVTPRSFGAHDPSLRAELEGSVGEVRYNTLGRPMSAAELRQQIGDVDGLLAGLDDIDASVFDAAPNLKVVARYGVGVSNVDLAAARRHGVIVTNTPDCNTDAVAEVTIGLIFALMRSLVDAVNGTRNGRWKPVAGMQLAGRTIGILGAGRIGQAVARRATALGCHVLAYDPYGDPGAITAAGARPVSLPEALGAADILSLHLPLSRETAGFVDARLMAQLRPGAILINTARGGLIVEEDVLDALESGRLAGAALDTLREEPPPRDHPLLRRDDVLVTPHIGAQTAEATTAMGRASLDGLIAVLSERTPRFPVVPDSEMADARS